MSTVIPQITQPLQLLLFGGDEVDVADPTVAEAIAVADLVIAVGDIDLTALAPLIGSKPAVCVLGDRDQSAQPPAPFRVLHGNGFVLHGWRIGGISGGPETNPGCVHLTDDEARSKLAQLPACDILVSHCPPAGFEQETGEQGSQAIADFIDEMPPAYVFHANSTQATAVIDDLTLIAGVHGILLPPPLTL